VYNTVHTPLTFRLVEPEEMTSLSRDRLLSATADGATHTLTAGVIPLLCINFQKDVHNDFKVVSPCTLHGTLKLMELCKSRCYSIEVSVLGRSHNSFHDCSVTKLSKLLSDVPFHGGATLAVYIDCQQALLKFRNLIIFRF